MKYVLPNILKFRDKYIYRVYETSYNYWLDPSEKNYKAACEAYDEYYIFVHRYRVHIERSLENEEVIR